MSIYICEVCGHIEFNEAPSSCPVCWSPKEKYQNNDNVFKESEEKSSEASAKHIPKLAVKNTCDMFDDQDCVFVSAKIGEVTHPMEEKHFIQFVDYYLDYKFIKRAAMSPDVFCGAAAHLKSKGNKVTVVERCNVHGWWMAEVEL